jgi:hypothetical protein
MLSGFIGNSMHPTLSESDLLEIRAYGHRPVRIGDVVYCVPPGEDGPVVHRVVLISSDEIRTRGDNSRVTDAWVLQPQDIRGQVVAAWRGKRRRMIAGGRGGQLRVGLIRTLRRAARPLRRLPIKLKPRVVEFRSGEQSHYILMLCGRQVGHYDSEQNRWILKIPFVSVHQRPSAAI